MGDEDTLDVAVDEAVAQTLPVCENVAVGVGLRVGLGVGLGGTQLCSVTLPPYPDSPLPALTAVTEPAVKAARAGEAKLLPPPPPP